MKLREGNIFSRVCPFTGACDHYPWYIGPHCTGTPPSLPLGHGTPPYRPSLPQKLTLGGYAPKRAVCSLLECFDVWSFNFDGEPYWSIIKQSFLLFVSVTKLSAVESWQKGQIRSSLTVTQSEAKERIIGTMTEPSVGHELRAPEVPLCTNPYLQTTCET